MSKLTKAELEAVKKKSGRTRRAFDPVCDEFRVWLLGARITRLS